MNVYSIFKIRNKPPSVTFRRHIIKLSRSHPRFKRIVRRIGSLSFSIPVWPSIDDAVLYATVGQMLSASAAASIITKLLNEFGSSKQVMLWASKSFKKRGPAKSLSQRKRRTLAEWLLYIKTSSKTHSQWGTMPLKEYRRIITRVWGLGPWAADVVAIFHLGRMDVWPERDAGIQRACKQFFNTRDTTKVRRYVKGCETVAALYLWEALNRNLDKDVGGRRG